MEEKEQSKARENDATLLSQYYFQQLRQRAKLESALFAAHGILVGSYIFSVRWYEAVWTIVVARQTSQNLVTRAV